MATIKDVAKYAGLSPATVSRVIRNQSNVTDKTRNLVINAIRDLNFQPNALARQLRQQETKTVIVIVPDIGNSFFRDIIKGIEKIAYQNNYQVFLADMQNNPEIEAYYFNALLQKQADGVISLSASVAQRLMEQVASQYPVVIVCQYMENSDLPNVTIDNVSASKRIMEHLINMGHTRIAHLTAFPNILLYRDRLTGYYQALAEHGIQIDTELVRYGNSSFQSGYDQMMELLELKKPVTAVFAAGDILAVGAMKALKASGKRIPEDCAVVGFDDIDLSSIYDPTLTTIRQPKREMGEIAMSMLLELINGNKPTPNQHVLDYELVVRESCGGKKTEEP